MKIATLIVQNLVRLIGVVLIVLGFLFWTHHAYELVPLHENLGVILVLLLWTLAVLAAIARLSAGLIIGAVLWGLITAAFGMTMGRLLPGRAHEAIRVLHFLIGLGAIGLAESLGARLRRKFGAAGSQMA